MAKEHKSYKDKDSEQYFALQKKIENQSILYSVPVERNVLCGLLKFQDNFADIEHKVSDSHFFNNSHKKIFQTIRMVLSHGEKLDHVILAQKMNDMGISFGDDIDIFEYVESLNYSQINYQGFLDSIKEIDERKIRREMWLSLYDMGKIITDSNKSVEEVVSSCEKSFGEKIFSFESLDEPCDLFAGIEQDLLERAKNPIEEMGYKTPFSRFNQMYGGIRTGNIYAFVARAKQGKTTFLNYLAFSMTRCNPGLKVLILDTEMQTKEIQFRVASSILEVPTWYLETGNFSKNKEYKANFEKNKHLLNDYKNNVSHIHVAGKPVSRIASIIRRWYFKQRAEGHKDCMIVYDYLKLSGEKLEKNWAEYQALGEKVDVLKQLSVELNLPILTACQANRSQGEGFDVVAMSDRISWFATAVFHFKRKNEEELQKIGDKYGTHSLVEIVTRFQGRDSAGHHNKIKILEGKDQNKKNKYRYYDNYINFEIKNFTVTERGTLKDIIDERTNKGKLEAENNNEDDFDFEE